CGPLEADLHEGRLHARHDPADPALVDVAGIASPAGALDVDLLEHAVLDQGDARFARGDVDQEFFGHGVRGRMGAWPAYSGRGRVLSNAASQAPARPPWAPRGAVTPPRSSGSGSHSPSNCRVSNRGRPMTPE